MKKFAMLMLVCCLAVSVNAGEIRQLTDYLADPSVDNSITGTWDSVADATFGGYDLEHFSAQSTDWRKTGFPYYDGSFIVGMGEDAYVGTQAMGFETHSTYGAMGVETYPSQYLFPGDTWEFDFAVKSVPSKPCGDVLVRIVANGAHGSMTIPAAEITDEWVKYSFSGTYTGTEAMWPNGWNVQILMPQPGGNVWAGVMVDVVPEPATMSLLGLGALGLIRRKR